METLIQDLRYGFRMLVKSPAFTIVAVLTLALGIGANTAIFSLIDAVLLRMLPVQHPEQLVVLGDPEKVYSRTVGTPETDVFSYPLYRELRDHNAVFTGMQASGEVHRLKVTEGDETPAQDALGALVSGNYFSVLGVNALMGRTITPEDDSASGAQPVAVISYGYWTRRFGQDPGIMGKAVHINGYPFTIVGVTPPGFYGNVVGDLQDVWMPMMMQPQVLRGHDWLENVGASWLHVMARLKPGVSVEQAHANINVLFHQIIEGPFMGKISSDDLPVVRRSSIRVGPGGRGLSQLRKDFYGPLMLLMAMVGLILLIACVNVANLLLARASMRQREIAVRLAAGATPRRLVRQLLTESVLLSLLGGVLGIFLANWGRQLLLKLALNSAAGDGLIVQPDLRIFAFTAAVCLSTGILFGLIPALRAIRVQIAPTLKDTTQASSGFSAHTAKFSWGKILVIAQVAISLLVLFTAGLLVHSLRNLRNLDMGYNQEHLITASLDPVAAGYKDADILRMCDALSGRLAATPGVRGTTYSQNGIFSHSESDELIKVEGFTRSREADHQSYFDLVGPNYFSTLGIPVLLGREPGPQDMKTAPRVTVINQTMARYYFGTANPLGKKIWIDDVNFPNQSPYEIIGVVKDARDHSVREAPVRRFYVPMTQNIRGLPAANFEVRTAGSVAAAIASVRNEIRNYDPNLPVISIHAVDELISESLHNEILIAQLSSSFGLLALLLTSIGLYGVMSYNVSGRTREIGVRMALGAEQRNVLSLILKEAMLMLAAGLAIGIPLALAGSQLLRSMLFGVSGIDLASLVAVVVLLGSVAIFAGFLPARRATRIDPMLALRYE